LNVEVRPRYFEPAEADDRKGLVELAYHQGKHMVYDELLRRHPDVVIEWCASGGTMIDLGTLRRIHTIWVTDYTEMYPWQGEKYNTDCTRVTRSRLNWIFPACLIMNTVYAPEQVLHSETNTIGMDNMLTQFGSLFGIGQSLIRWKREDLDSAKKAIGVYKRVRGYLNKEFRGLLGIPETQDVWDAWQFHDPESRRGVMMFYRLVDCDSRTQSVQPHWMTPEDDVTFDVLLGEATLDRDGTDLAVNMSSGAAIVEYRIG
jgi:alpha-galactosidase